jgi:energy-coupling factor transporter ATP-binding protein EcfA2
MKNAPQKTAFQSCLEQADRLGLYAIDPQLQIMARTAGNSPGSLQEKVRALFVARVQQYTASLTAVPFLPGPPQLLANGLFTIGTVGGVPLRLTPAEIRRHVLYAGPSGSGKTTALQPLALQFRQAGGHLIVADFKNDMSSWAARDSDCIILHPDVPLNILDHPDYVQRSDYINLLITLLTRSYYGGEHLRQVAHETLWESYRRHEHPSIKDWYEATKERLSPKDTYQRRDAYNGLLMRLTRIIEQVPGMARTNVGIPHRALWEHSLYLGALHQNDTTEFLTAWTVHNYYLWARAHQIRDTLRYLILLDEGLLTFGEGNRIDGPVLLPLVPLLREYGAALAIATAHLGAIHETIRANMYTTILLPLANATRTSDSRRETIPSCRDAGTHRPNEERSSTPPVRR